MRLLILVWLISLSGGTAALLGARAAWRLKDSDNHRPELAVAWAIGLLCYGVADLAITYKSIVDGPRNQKIGFLVSALLWRLVQSAGVWIIALTLMNGRRGVLRTALSKVIEKFR